MTSQEHKFYSNPEDRLIPRIFIGFFAALNFVLDAALGRYVSWNPSWMRYKYFITISDGLNYRISEYEHRTFKNDDLPDEHYLEEQDVYIQWNDIKSCKINKSERTLTVKDIHGNQIIIGEEFIEHLTIWSLIIEKAKQASPTADIDNLIIQS